MFITYYDNNQSFCDLPGFVKEDCHFEREFDTWRNLWFTIVLFITLPIIFFIINWGYHTMKAKNSKAFDG